MEFSTGNPLIDCLLLLGLGGGVGYFLKKDSPAERHAMGKPHHYLENPTPTIPSSLFFGLF